MIWLNSMEKRWFRRFVSLVSLTLGNSVSWESYTRKMTSEILMV